MRIDADHPLVLASGSPRRREILENLRVPHVVLVASANEDVAAGESPDAYLARVVLAKLAAARAALTEKHARAVAILVADTSVIVGGEILGKPRDVDEAAKMITQLAGTTHDVKTRFAIASCDLREQGAHHVETVTTRVMFRPLDAAAVRSYAESGEGLDKAGAYAVQGLGASLVMRIEGSYSNVVGLPACEVAMALERLGLVAV